jgi:hypothetical protein
MRIRGAVAPRAEQSVQKFLDDPVHRVYQLPDAWLLTSGRISSTGWPRGEGRDCMLITVGQTTNFLFSTRAPSPTLMLARNAP